MKPVTTSKLPRASEGHSSALRIVRMLGRQPVAVALQFPHQAQHGGQEPLRFVPLPDRGARHGGTRATVA